MGVGRETLRQGFDHRDQKGPAMTAAYEELIHLLDEREIGYLTSDDQAIRTDLRGEVATYRVVARVEAESDCFRSSAVRRCGFLKAAGRPLPKRSPGPTTACVWASSSWILTTANCVFRRRNPDRRAVGEEVIDRMISTTLNMLDMYLPAFCR